MATLHSELTTRQLYSRISYSEEKDIRYRLQNLKGLLWHRRYSIQSNKSLRLRIFLSNLLQVQPEERYGVEEVKSSEWFENVDWNMVFLKKIEPPKVTFKQISPKEHVIEGNFTNFSLSEPDQTYFDDNFSEF